MGLLHSLRVVAAMARETVPTVIESRLGRIDRHTLDGRTHRFARRAIDILDVDLKVTGGGAVSPRATYVYMSNHQSHLDIPILYASLPSPTIRMLAKTELFRIPVWGSALRAAEFIEVDRADPVRARDSVRRAADLLRDGVSVYLAPEGTRSRDGRIGPLKKGGFHLALDTGTPIVPVAIRGTIDILPRGTRTMHPGRTVHVHIGDPIAVAGRTVADLSAEVEQFLRRHVEQAA
ncbi:MAG TPA: lysophospholipid acyltransferase family protein [Kofleriaceae bacterium]|nr:lysophospholipid acyltransferase family protein [Kofleriaceae bacterium]